MGTESAIAEYVIAVELSLFLEIKNNTQHIVVPESGYAKSAHNCSFPHTFIR